MQECKDISIYMITFYAKRNSKQFFSHVGTEPPLSGYYHYLGGGGGGGVNMSWSRTLHGDPSRA